MTALWTTFSHLPRLSRLWAWHEKYGRDFMRNMRFYMEFRKVALFEEMGGNPLEYFAQDSQAEQFNDIVKE